MAASRGELEALYRDRYPAFRCALAPVTGSYESAHDVVQEAFARAIAQRRRFRGDAPLGAWVWTIALRVALDERRRPVDALLGETAELGLVEPARDPELSSALMLLPPRRRLVFFLRYFADLSYREIAAVCEISEGTVAASIHRRAPPSPRRWPSRTRSRRKCCDGAPPSRRRRREHLGELDLRLREHVLALDEPVAWDDWNDVVARARASRAHAAAADRGRRDVHDRRRRRRRGRARCGRVAPSFLQPGSGGASASAPRELAEFDLGAPATLPVNAIAAQTRVITSVRSGRGTYTLYVSPTAQGGFCYRWTGDGTGGCGQLGRSPLTVSWGTGRVVGVVSSLYVSSVRIGFTDGTYATPRIAWISAPLHAGFFLYDIPAGKTVAEVTGFNDEQKQGQVTWYSV